MDDGTEAGLACAYSVEIFPHYSTRLERVAKFVPKGPLPKTFGVGWQIHCCFPYMPHCQGHDLAALWLWR